MLGFPFLVIHLREFLATLGNFWASFIAVNMQAGFYGPYEVAKYLRTLYIQFQQEETPAERHRPTLQTPLETLRKHSSAEIMRRRLIPRGGTNTNPGAKLSFNTVARGEGPELSLKMVHEVPQFNEPK
jgi:hypothetical protein